MIGKVLDSRYELVEFIGKGGMALVYRALDKRTGHSVAVKILRPEFIQDAEFCSRFEREALTASKMSHHNIVNLLDVGQDNDIRYLVMEYVKGRTLKDVIRQKGALPPTVAAQIAIRILSALQHAHKNGIIHRDIKPQNILVNNEGLIKVGDFGIARVAGSNTISTDDSVMGSVHYFSPEQAKGENVTAASDLYSVGVVMYEMLTGKPPYDGETPIAVAMQHIGGKPVPISELNPSVPPALEQVVEKAMEKRPDKRYQSALEMAQDIQRALQEPDGTWLGRLPDQPISSLANHTGNTDRQKAVRTPRVLWTRIGMIALIVLVLGGMAIGAANIYDQVVNTTEAPYCLDETEEEAIHLLKRATLNYEISRTTDAQKAAGTVIMQSPEYGTSMRKNETVFLTISTGPEKQEIPMVTGMNVESARSELEKMGFTLLALPDRVQDDSEWDTVLSQDPEPSALMPSGTVVQVKLSGGTMVLPDFVGMNRDEALFQIQQQNLNLVPPIREIPVEDSTQFDRVAAQFFSDEKGNSYMAGDQAMLHTQVTLAVYISSVPLEESVSPETQETLPPEEGGAP